MEEILKEVVLVLLGFALGAATTWLDRKRRLKTHWFAIRAEIELCREKAQTLMNDGIKSPLYRLPLASYEVSFPVLLAEGGLSESEVLEMGRFFSQVQDINRGLDNATALLNANDLPGVQREYDRNLIKASALLNSKGSKPSLYTRASEMAGAKAAMGWWRY